MPEELRDDLSIDEEEMQDLQASRTSSSRLVGPRKSMLRNKRYQQFGSLQSRWDLMREDVYFVVVPLAVLALCGIGVIIFNLTRFSLVEPCDENRPMAKHFYCYDEKKPEPGVRR
jgi:hypothetical protein|eukprot:jgi/Chrpa1/8378/Chrysochromulina_OHIO_Genome00008202-RA